MKRIALVLAIAFALAGNVFSSQKLPGSILKNKSLLKSMPATIVGSYPQQVDWFDWVSAAWAPSKTQKISYSQDGDPLTIEWDLLTGTDQKFTYTYNNLRMPTLMLYQEFVGSTWVNKERSRIEYDGYSNPTLEVSEIYTDGAWVITGGILFTNDVQNGKLIHQAFANYDVATRQYLPVSRTTYTYTGDGQMSSFINEVLVEGVWINSTRTTMTYASMDKMSTMVIDSWEDGAWVPQSKHEYEWTTNDSFTMNIYMWDVDSSTYILAMRDVTQYDSHSNLILQTTEMGMAGMWFMLSGSKFDITYQGNTPTQQITQEWNGTEFVNSTKEVFTNYLNLGINDLTATVMDFDVYPNPASESLNIKIITTGLSAVNLEMISMTGKLVRSEVVSNSSGPHSWDISGLPAGIYSLRMVGANGSVISKKIVIH